MILPDVVWHVFSAASGGYTKVRKGGGGGAGGVLVGRGSALPHYTPEADSGHAIFFFHRILS